MRPSIVAMAIVVVAGCGSSPQSADPAADFQKRVEAGATCAELFEFRNALDPKAAAILTINVGLRDIGCFSSTSTRKPTESAGAVGAEPQAGEFTVAEYRIYRMVLDTPMSVSEAESLSRAAKQHEIAVERVREVVNRVQRELYENKWLSRPELEIQHASDWKGESK